MIPGKNRLRRGREAGDATRVFSRMDGKHVSIRFTYGGASPLMTAAVSAKVSKTAVGRNRIKRAIRAALARVIPKARPGVYIVSAKGSAASTTLSEVQCDVESVFASLAAGYRDRMNHS